MGQVYAHSIDIYICLGGVDVYTELVTEKIVGPEIVIAQDIVNINICFPQLIELADNVAVLFRDDPLIFEPEIKKITDDEKCAPRFADHIKESK